MASSFFGRVLNRKYRILIVEAEDNARKGYEALLQRWGYEVFGVASAEDVQRASDFFQPDAMIVDVELSGMNRLGLLQQLEAGVRHVPAIIIYR